MMNIRLNSPGKTIISLHQMDSRNFSLPQQNISFSETRFEDDEDTKQHSYSYFRVLIGKIGTLKSSQNKFDMAKKSKSNI